MIFFCSHWFISKKRIHFLILSKFRNPTTWAASCVLSRGCFCRGERLSALRPDCGDRPIANSSVIGKSWSSSALSAFSALSSGGTREAMLSLSPSLGEAFAGCSRVGEKVVNFGFEADECTEGGTESGFATANAVFESWKCENHFRRISSFHCLFEILEILRTPIQEDD